MHVSRMNAGANTSSSTRTNSKQSSFSQILCRIPVSPCPPDAPPPQKKNHPNSSSLLTLVPALCVRLHAKNMHTCFAWRVQSTFMCVTWIAQIIRTKHIHIMCEITRTNHLYEAHSCVWHASHKSCEIICTKHIHIMCKITRTKLPRWRHEHITLMNTTYLLQIAGDMKEMTSKRPKP